MRAAWLLVVACAPDGDPARQNDTLTLSCEKHADNDLRAICTVTADPPAEVTLEWGPSGGPPEQHRVVPVPSDPSSGPADRRAAQAAPAETTVTLLWFSPRTEHTITATTAGGANATTTFTTDSVPGAVATVYTVEGTSSVRRILHETRCENTPFVVVSSTTGKLLYYANMAPNDPGAELWQVEMTPEGTLVGFGEGKPITIGTPDEQWIREFDLYGNLLFEVNKGVHYDLELTHEVTKKNGYYYALFLEVFEKEGQKFHIDGFYVFDGAGDIVATWHLLDHVDQDLITGTGKLVDWSHANSIFVTADGDVAISFRYLSLVILVKGDWTSPDFGEVVWWLAGDPGAPNPFSTWSIVSSASVPDGFARQHHATFLGPDRLTVFDNQFTGQDSRLLSIALDAATGVADIDSVYTLDHNCAYQGAYYTLPNGNPFATCSPDGMAFEFDVGAPTHRYSMKQQCYTGLFDGVFRFVPIDEQLTAVGELPP